jgi:hypothetical protein
MKPAAAVGCLVMLFGAVAAVPQSHTPTPNPELKKQDFFLGEWTLEGTTKGSAFGPGGQKFKSTERLEWMPGGFFLLAHSYVEGKLAELTIIGYDAEEKAFTHTSYGTGGNIERWLGTARSDTWTWTREGRPVDGKAIRVRLTIIKTSPRSYSFVQDVKAGDAADWSIVAEGTGVKSE